MIIDRAIVEAQEQLERRVSELTGELYADEFQYWPKLDKKRSNRRQK